MVSRTLDVLIRDHPKVQDYFSNLTDSFSLDDIWYRLRSKHFPNVWVERNKIDQGVLQIDGLPPFHDALSVWTERIRHTREVLEVAQQLAGQYKGIVYNSSAKRAITSFLEDTTWESAKKIPHGRLVYSRADKALLLEEWPMSEEQRGICRSMLGDQRFYFAPSGHIVLDENIFGLSPGDYE